MRPRILGSLSAVLLLVAALSSVAGQPCGPQNVADLRRMSGDELLALYRSLEPGRPLDGELRGGLVHLEGRAPRVKLRLANFAWRGKTARACDGHFVNRWVGGVRWIESHYVLGPSWIDGRPTQVMEYAPGTPLFANVRDELREVSPGLYLGPLFDRCPCPRLRGFIAIQAECR